MSTLKHPRQTVGLLILIFILFGFAPAKAQLSGNYTIDAGSSTAGNNFKSFKDLKVSLDNNGVNGAVTINVKSGSGPYQENIVLDSVKGTNASNTITINGNGEKITTSKDSFVIQMNRARFYTLKNLVIEAAGTGNGIRCLQFLNSSNNNTVDSCELIISKYSGTTASSAYIAFSASTTGNSAGAHGSNNTFNNNKMWNGGNDGKGPYYGVLDYRSSSFSSTVGNNIYNNNEVRDVYHSFFYFFHCNGMQVTNNKIHTNRKDAIYAYGIYRYYNVTTSVANKFDNNEIYNLKPRTYAYMAYTSYTAGTSSLKLTINGNKAHDNGGQYTYGFQNYYNCDFTEMIGNELYNNAPTYYLWFGFMNFSCFNCVVKDNRVYDNSPGYYLYYATYAFGCTNLEFDGNSIYNNTPGLGMYYSLMLRGSANVTATNNLYYNNRAQGLHFSVLYVNACADIVIAHNTFVIDDSVKGNNFGIWNFVYNATPVSVQVKNNILLLNSYNASGNQTPIISYLNTNAIEWANNVVYDISPGSKSYVANGVQYNSFEQWASQAKDSTSLVADPVFTNMKNGNFKPTNPTIANIGTPGLADEDFNGVKRSTCGPDPGAFEFTVNHSVANFNFKGKNECGGYTEAITFDFINGVASDLQNVPVFYSINGGTPVRERIASVGKGKTVTYTFKNVPIFHEPGDNVIVVGLWCDDSTADNQLTKTLKITPAPYGFYLSEGNNFEGYFMNNPGRDGPDVTASGKQIAYIVNNPIKYPGATFGTDWEMVPLLHTKGGKKITNFTFTSPSSTAKGSVLFTATDQEVDSTLFIGMMVRDLITGCDSIFGRFLYITPTPKVDWSAGDHCDGEIVSFKNGTTQLHGNFDNVWDFSDPNSGSKSTTTLIHPIHIFSGPGVYKVSLTVWNHAYPKFVYSLTKNITIYAKPDVCFKIKNACEGDTVKFTNCTSSTDPASIIYSWNFGDGSAKSFVKDPEHVYAKVGGYPTTLTAVQNGCVSSLTRSANQFAEPKADFVFSGECNLTDVSFINRSTISLGQVGYNWDFGDNTTSNLPHPKHVFQTPGNHTITLKVTSEFGCVNEIQKNLTLKESPTADFTYSSPCNLNPTVFTHTGTVPSGNIIFFWNFNGEDQSVKQNTSYLFKSIGVKRVSLTVRADNGCSDEQFVDFVVKIQADVDFTANTVCEGEDMVFTNKTTASVGKLKFIWRFGDGNVSDLTSPRHAYSLQQSGVAESFNVTLVVQVEGGCTDSIAKSVTVNAGSNPVFTAATSGRDLFISNQVTTAANNTYNWRFGDGGRSGDITPQYTYTNVDKGSFEVCLNLINKEGCVSNHCEKVTVDLLGVSFSDNTVFSIYPNPTEGLLNVVLKQFGESDIVVVDAHGKIIRHVVIDGFSQIQQIDLRELAAGIYYIQVQQTDESAIKRITVVK